MDKQILIYEKDPKVQKFLRAFFKAKDGYSAHFTRKEQSALRKEILKRKPDAFIISSPDGLKHINPEDLQCPVIAIISSDRTHGIRSVIESDIECYLLSPFHKDELSRMLQYVIKEALAEFPLKRKGGSTDDYRTDRCHFSNIESEIYPESYCAENIRDHSCDKVFIRQYWDRKPSVC